MGATVKVLGNVVRRRFASVHEVENTLRATRAPLVLSGMFGDPADVLERLETQVVETYHENDPGRRIERLPLRSVLHQLENDSFDGAVYEERIDTKLLCQPNHDILELFGAPADDAVALMFFSHAGASAHLHYDFDGRLVVLTQLVGAKRVLMLPPTRTRPIPAMAGVRSHWSTICLESLRAEERYEFAGFMGAFDTVLEPGDSLVIPAGWWHYVDYLSGGGGASLRLGRPPELHTLFRVAERLPSRFRWIWQALVAGFPIGSDRLADLSGPVDLLFQGLYEPQADIDATAFTSVLRELYCGVVGDDRHVFIDQGRPPVWKDVEEWFRNQRAEPPIGA